MHHFNHLTDLCITLTTQADGIPVDATQHDFEASFYTLPGKSYTCARYGNDWTNCKPGDDGNIVCLLDNHQLQPGQLSVLFAQLIPDNDFHDHYRRVVTHTTLDIILTESNGDDAADIAAQCGVDVQAILDIIAHGGSADLSDYYKKEEIDTMLASKPSVFDAVGEPPLQVGAAGTICRVDVRGWRLLNDGDTVTFPLMVTQWESGMFCNSLFMNRYGMDNYGLCWDDHGQPNYLDERVGEGGAKLYNDDWEIEEYYAAGYTDAGFENFNPNGLIFEAYVWATVGYKLYMSDGTRWMELGENGGSGGTPNIYVEMLEGIPDGGGDLMKMLVVRGAEPFLNDDFVPVLLRHSRKKNGWGWHHYNPAQYKAGGQDKSPDDVVVDDFGGYKVVYVLGAELNHELVNMPRPHYNDGGIIDCSDGDVLDEILADTVVLHVSHGKRKFAVLELDGDIGELVTRTIRTKWGLAFIRRSDYPALNERLDVSKLASNIAPFTIYYGWRKDYELNDKVLCTRVLT